MLVAEPCDGGDIAGGSGEDDAVWRVPLAERVGSVGVQRRWVRAYVLSPDRLTEISEELLR